MKKFLATLLLAPLAALAADDHDAAQVQQDIERHRQMAAAHAAAAQCLAAGRKPADCLKELQAACKGLAIGKYCGMRHAH